ncbi:MAG: Geranylgeranyl diphosphate synthase [Candidatus Methanofastidiosum methylothiophilum]|uniref:Geranylgeranyl diphosphate synthase n=1 Tax=Candidatus Methanofastidiosum methylothiophilum TaxID=1705564 RepID=A0A150IL71_9EURY|nr:MAG: Geranylgeranyl diphosphate synthase [Candidatus Methanofastidiosum methylthiophilus]KYC48014.1 MAG: Geranylgeranyl diphosphate synthase [Candidatus Methanofastidiosum methylthiophilus]KYC50704.1 MAG: Geranylgeranyl diphosphate synthase [Candidatus Methanofastidiosum methylthiophilus]
MSHVDIIKVIESKKDFIEKTLEKYIPKDINSYNFKSKSRYEVDFKAINYGISKPIWDFLSYGGKRWRPVLFLLISEALGADMKKISDFLVIPEIAHNGTIIIDDIEDNADLRRGKPALHKVYGEDIAINCGNAMYFLPLQVVEDKKGEIPAETLFRVYSIYLEEMRNLHYGQALDITWHKGILKKEPNVEEYLQMTAFKTGTLARMAARMAVALSGKDEIVENKFGKFAESIGIAFQIQDDLLDIITTEKEREAFGKSYGNDIREGKRSLAIIYTLSTLEKTKREKLIKILNSHTNEKKIIDEAIKLIKETDSIEKSRETANRLVIESWNEINNELKESEAKINLKAFSEFLIKRKI